MNVRELVGKKAIRTDCIVNKSGFPDISFTTRPILISEIINNYILYSHLEDGIYFKKDELLILREEFDDNNWADYDELVSGIDMSSNDFSKNSFNGMINLPDPPDPLICHEYFSHNKWDKK